MGRRAKLWAAFTALRTSCSTPMAPPMKTYAPPRLTAKKANTTGSPSIIRATRPPMRTARISYHSNGRSPDCRAIAAGSATARQPSPAGPAWPAQGIVPVVRPAARARAAR